VLGSVLCYVCTSLLLQTRDDFRFLIPFVEFARDVRGLRPNVLDATSIVDGRLADLAAAGIFDSRFVIPAFVLDELHVLRVAVFGAHRGAGIGRALVRALHARATGADAAWLEVRRDNAPAIAMYASLGYAPIAVRPRYYTDGCDALVLRLDRPGTTGAA
jgi:ribosomal protein S18 acetylase RimI-like enzyme